MGVGLVEQVDDLRASNPASNEELLNDLSQYLVEKKFDLKELMRVILQSEAYQRSSEVLPGNKNEKRFYSRYYPRRLMAEVLLDAISKVTQAPTVFDEMRFLGADKVELKDYPLGTRALQLHDSAVTSYFLKTFGRNNRMITCECERSEEPSMVQVLHIAGGREEPEVRAEAGGREGYHVLGFCDRMADAYAVADVVISRAGASSLTELAHAGLPSILVPYPYAADDHQTRNGEVFAQAGAAEMVQESDLDENKLAEMIDGILGDLPTCERMAQAARGLAVPDAAARVAGVIEESCEMEEREI